MISEQDNLDNSLKIVKKYKKKLHQIARLEMLDRNLTVEEVNKVAMVYNNYRSCLLLMLILYRTLYRYSVEASLMKNCFIINVKLFKSPVVKCKAVNRF